MFLPSGKIVVDEFRTKEKSRAEGGTIAEKAQQWQYYDHISFMKPYICTKGGKL